MLGEVAVVGAAEEEPDEEGSAEKCGDDADGEFRGGEDGACEGVAQREERAAEKARRGREVAMVGADHEPADVG